MSTPPFGSPASEPERRRRVRWPMLSLLVIVLVVGVALGVALRPLLGHEPSSAPPAPRFTDQQVADAKAKVCAAFNKVLEAVRSNFARDPGVDPTQQLAVAVNARQALLAGSTYLLTELSDEPATPPDLAAEVRKLANLYQIITINFLASEASNTERNASDEATSTIQRLCK